MGEGKRTRVTMPIVIQVRAESWNDDETEPVGRWTDISMPGDFERLADAERWVATEGRVDTTYRVVRVSLETLTPREVTTRKVDRDGEPQRAGGDA